MNHTQLIRWTWIDVDARNYSWWWCRLLCESICLFEVITRLSALPSKLTYFEAKIVRLNLDRVVKYEKQSTFGLGLSVSAPRAHACVNRFHLHNFIHSLFIEARLWRIRGRISCNPHTHTHHWLSIGIWDIRIEVQENTKQQTDN